MNRRIFVIADEPHLRLRLQEMMGSWGYLALPYRNAGSALIAASTGTTADVVLLDLLHGIDRFDPVSLLRRHLPGVPVIACCAGLTPQTYLRAVSMGAFECLDHTVMLADLRRVIEKAVEGPASQGARARPETGTIVQGRFGMKATGMLRNVREEGYR